MSAALAAFSAYEQKWLTAFPENAVLRIFLPLSDQLLNAALGCLALELEHSALYIAEPQIAATKLNWWGEELAFASAQSARHPVTQILFADMRARAIAPNLWQQWVHSATTQLDCESSADFSTQLEQTQQFNTPLAQIETELFFANNKRSVGAMRLAACAQLLRQLTLLSQELQQGRLPLPLSLLARHQLNRDSLAVASAQRTAALRDYLEDMAKEIRSALALGEALSPSRQVRARLDLVLISRAVCHPDPLKALTLDLGAGCWRSLWYSWRAARTLIG